jgi:hypothetical protein
MITSQTILTAIWLVLLPAVFAGNPTIIAFQSEFHEYFSTHHWFFEDEEPVIRTEVFVEFRLEGRDGWVASQHSREEHQPDGRGDGLGCHHSVLMAVV